MDGYQSQPNSLTISGNLHSNSDALNSKFLVPTTDEEVRIRLRHLNEPITLFGEDRAARRSRLIKLTLENGGDVLMESSGSENESEESDDEFYTPGLEELLEARKYILNYSLSKSKLRLEKQKNEFNTNFIKLLKHKRLINDQLEKTELVASQLLSSNRPISVVRISPFNNYIATGSWDGNVHILNKTDLSTKVTLRSHTEKVGGVDWHPYSESIQTSTSLNLISSGAEGDVCLWSLESSQKKPLGILKGHEGRVCRTQFHPSGKYCASASFDMTWRLWDLDSQKEILTQEGHSKELFAISFNKDGSLIASGGLDAIGRVWDLRSGRSISVLEGHIKSIHGVDWSPNGYHIATGSADGSCKIWDLRMNKETFSIPAHTNVISDVKFFNRNEKFDLDIQVTDENNNNAEKLETTGEFLVTSSYDSTVAIWSSSNWLKIKTLKTNEKIMSCDIASNGQEFVSSGWDRTVKLWGNI